MKLYIVRHGETDWNKKRRIQGQVDIPLNDFGRSLARKTAKGLSGIPFEVCYTSPLGQGKGDGQTDSGRQKDAYFGGSENYRDVLWRL